MALIVLASAGGAPGVSTSALGLTLAWPRSAVLVDADPSGPSAVLAGYLRATETPAKGIVDLVMAQRGGYLAAELPEVLRPIRHTASAHQADPTRQRLLLPGALSHDQALAVASVWQPLAAELKDLERHGQDVIVDLGRLGTQGFAAPLVEAADLVLLVVRSDLLSLSTASQWTTRLGPGGTLEAVNAGGARVLIVGNRHPHCEPISERTVAKALKVPVAATLAWDPATAAVYSHGAEPDKSKKQLAAPLTRSLQAAAEQVSVLVERLTAARAAGLQPTHAEPAGFAAFRRRL